MHCLHLKIASPVFTFGICSSYSGTSAKGWIQRPNNKFVSFNKDCDKGNEFNVALINLGEEFCVSFAEKKLIGWGGVVEIFVS